MRQPFFSDLMDILRHDREEEGSRAIKQVIKREGKQVGWRFINQVLGHTNNVNVTKVVPPEGNYIVDKKTKNDTE